MKDAHALAPVGLGGLTGRFSYSPGFVAGDFIFVSGQVPLDESDELVGPGDVAAQTRQAISRVKRVLNEAGADLSDIVSATVYLQDFSDVDQFDEAWSSVFRDHRPSRATVEVTLYDPKWLVGIQAVAYKARG